MSWRGRLISELNGCGGRLSHRLAQSDSPLRPVLNAHKKTEAGICRGLVEKWLVMGAKGEDFWQWLCPGGKVNAAAATSIAFNHLESDNARFTSIFKTLPDGTAVDIATGATSYFRYYGGLDVDSQKDFISVGGNLFREFGKYLGEELTRDNLFVFLGMYNSDIKSGHALGLRTMSGGTLCFYDPNVGEFEFDGREGFKDWLEEAFSKVGGYAKYPSMTCMVLVKK